jgi:hypothetical protein
MSDAKLYRCLICRTGNKPLRSLVCAACYRKIQMRRRQAIGLASPFSKSRLQRPPPTNVKH